MHKFKVGDYVKILDGSYSPHRFVAWMSSMDKLIGNVDVVDHVYADCGIYTLRDCGKYMAEDWLAPVTTAKFVPKIKKVIVNEPATIIIWDDDVKTVVKCGANDTFDVEKGIAMAYIKRIMFDNKTTQMNKWFQQYEEELTVGAVHE